MVYNGYYKVMSNIPILGPMETQKVWPFLYASWISVHDKTTAMIGMSGSEKKYGPEKSMVGTSVLNRFLLHGWHDVPTSWSQLHTLW